MEFLKITDKMTSSELIHVLEENLAIASFMRREINNLKEEPYKVIELDDVKGKKEIRHEEKEEDSFEDEVEYYLDDYKKLIEVNEENIRDILPSRSNYDFEKIVLRLMSESLKEIKELSELIDLEADKEVLEEIKVNIEKEQEKINILKRILFQKEEKEEKRGKNNIILVPTLSGNIRILDDLEHLPEETYDGFKELIDSIENNTFKGVKRLVEYLISEVRGDGIRILFGRLNRNTYALITAFQKKTTANSGYREFLKGRVSSYKQVIDYLKDNLEDEDFLNENEENKEKLYKLLSKRQKERIK